MIALASDCLLFEMANGESLPLSALMISVELMGQAAGWFDPEFVGHAANAVFHYFKQGLGRKTVTLSEFAHALEKVLRGFKTPGAAGSPVEGGVVESDLCRLAHESGEGRELFFFALLREELRQRLKGAPRIVRFSGLRPCVMQLAGARRWSARCRSLKDQILLYLRGCLSAEGSQEELSLVVQ